MAGSSRASNLFLLVGFLIILALPYQYVPIFQR